MRLIWQEGTGLYKADVARLREILDFEFYLGEDRVKEVYTVKIDKEDHLKLCRLRSLPPSTPNRHPCSSYDMQMS